MGKEKDAERIRWAAMEMSCVAAFVTVTSIFNENVPTTPEERKVVKAVRILCHMSHRRLLEAQGLKVGKANHRGKMTTMMAISS